MVIPNRLFYVGAGLCLSLPIDALASDKGNEYVVASLVIICYIIINQIVRDYDGIRS